MGKHGLRNIKGRISNLQAMPYKDSMIYVRRIDGDIFEYLVVWKGQIYTNYIVMRPRKGMEELTKDDVIHSASLVFTSATVTVDMLRGEKVSEETKKIVEQVESARPQVEGKEVK